MKTRILGICLSLFSVALFAQKDELKAAEKALKKQDYATAVSSVDAAASLMSNMDTKMKAKFYYLKGQAYMGKKDFSTAYDAFDALKKEEKESGRKKYTDAAGPMLNQMVQEVYKKASNQYKNKDFGNAAKNFYLTYKLSPQDTTFIYNAAVSCTLTKDYDGALKYYRELQDLGYTGVTTMYFATNKETGVKENLGSKVNRDLMVKSGQYNNPATENTKSKRGDIVKNIAYILKEQGKTDEALAAVKKAREMFPKDLNLILTQADIYYQLGETEKFGVAMKEAIQEDPTNPQLFFNLGVISFDQASAKQKKAMESSDDEAKKSLMKEYGELKEKARGYYEKALNLKPDYGDAHMNMAVLVLDAEKAIVEEMNRNLSDFDKYDELLLKQKAVYKSALPFLEKADQYGRSMNTVQTLMNIYSTLEMTEKEKEFSALYKKMRNKQ